MVQLWRPAQPLTTAQGGEPSLQHEDPVLAHYFKYLEYRTLPENKKLVLGRAQYEIVDGAFTALEKTKA